MQTTTYIKKNVVMRQ